MKHLLVSNFSVTFPALTISSLSSISVVSSSSVKFCATGTATKMFQVSQQVKLMTFFKIKMRMFRTLIILKSVTR